MTVESRDSLARDRVVSGKREAVEAQTEAEYIEQIRRLPTSKEKRVVSYGLYGSNPKYTTGAIRNAELVKIYFPGWVARFYVDDTVPGTSTPTNLPTHPPTIHPPPCTIHHSLCSPHTTYYPPPTPH